MKNSILTYLLKKNKKIKNNKYNVKKNNQKYTNIYPKEFHITKTFQTFKVIDKNNLVISKPILYLYRISADI
jgi:hypothetical protein